MTPYEPYIKDLESLRTSRNFRSVPPDAPAGLMDFSSNDYLGLGADPELQRQFMADTARRMIPLTSSASRLLAGRQKEDDQLECLLARLYGGGRAALLFNSGYHANTGLISALASRPRTMILADKLVHASIIDGIILSKAPFERFVHNSVERLERLLNRHHDSCDAVIVAVESVYSMDGDRAPLADLIRLKERYPRMVLYVDEAHAFGCCGRAGLGLCHDLEEFDKVDIVVGTFGKAAASAGAFAVMAPQLRDYAVNRSRSFIFSTSLPPLNIAWTSFIVERLASMGQRRDALRSLAGRLNAGLKEAGLSAPEHPGHICPLIVGSAERALSLSSALAEEGLKVLPIRTPTVPPGTERLRISLSAAITPSEVDRLVSTLRRMI